VCGVQLSSSSADSSAWIAARFDGRMPQQLKLGDNSYNGGFVNRPLQKKDEYRVFVRAYTANDVSFRCFFVSQEYHSGKETKFPKLSLRASEMCNSRNNYLRVTIHGVQLKWHPFSFVVTQSNHNEFTRNFWQL